MPTVPGHRFVQNAAYKILGDFGGRGLALLQYVFLARWLGAEGFGEYSFAFSLAALFMPFMDLGSNALIARMVARESNRLYEISLRSNALKGFAGFIMICFVGLSGFLFEKTQGRSFEMIALMGLLIFATGALDYLAALFSGLEKMREEASLKILNKIFCLTGSFLGFFFGRSAISTVTGLVIGFLLSVCVGFLQLSHLGGSFALKWDLRWIKSFLQGSAPLIGAGFFLHCYENQDLFLLGLINRPASEIGHFNVCVKLMDVLKAIPFLLAGATFPFLSRIFKTDPLLFKKTAGVLLKWMVVLSFFFLIIVHLSASTLISLAFGKGYLSADPILSLLAYSLPALFLNNSIHLIFVSFDLQKKLAFGIIIATITNAFAVLYLTPLYGLRGTAESLILSEVIFLGYNFWVISKVLPEIGKDFLAYAPRPFIAFLISGIIIKLSPLHSPGLSSLLACGLYLAILFLLKGIPSGIPSLRSLFAKVRPSDMS